MHSRCPGFQTRRCYGVENRGQPGPRRSDDGKRRTKSGYTVLKQRLPANTRCEHRWSSDMIRISTVRPPGKPIEKPVLAVSIVELRRLPVWPRCVTGKSRRSPDSCRSNYGLARFHQVKADKVTVEPRYATTQARGRQFNYEIRI